MLAQHSKVDQRELGDLLLKVQDELKNIRTKISQDGSKVDLSKIQTSLMRAENELKEKTNNLLNDLNNQVRIMPAPDDRDVDGKFNFKIESLLDLDGGGGGKRTAQQQQQLNSATFTFSNDNDHRPKHQQNSSGDHIVIEEIQDIMPVSLNKLGPVDFKGLTPGQQMKICRENRALLNPENMKNRSALSENYNIQLPLIEKRNACKMSTHLITGSTIDHLSTLPLTYRRNPTLAPPPLDETEAKYGLLSIIERGLIPASSKIAFDPLPIAAKTLKPTDPNNRMIEKYKDINTDAEQLYKIDPRYENRKQSATTSVVSYEAKKIKQDPRFKRNARIDELLKDESNNISNKNINNTKTKETSENVQLAIMNVDSEMKTSTNNLSVVLFNNESKPVTAGTGAHAPTNSNANLKALNPMSPPATPFNVQQIQPQDASNKLPHKFTIQNGKTQSNASDYISFKQYYCLRWGNIVTIIKLLEDICKSYIVPTAHVDGHKVAELARNMDMDINPKRDQLLSAFINRVEIEKLVRTPGQKFKRKNGKHLAATQIQSAWRRYRDRCAYLDYRRRKWAAGVIALTWLTYVKLAKARDNLQRTRVKNLENFKKRQRELARAWPRLKTSRRVLIHLPSLCYNLQARSNMKDLVLKENYQMARLCDLADENVDIIYVTSLPINEETLQYYMKLLGLKGAINSGKTEDQIDLSHRYKIVIPEALNKFPTHNMALSTLLKYSPNAIERIKNLIKGREAYIVPGVMSSDDLYVADLLGVPIFGTEPEIANLYSTKSGSKRIFQSAKVSIPYGEFDIYNKQQLYECLAQAVTENLLIQRWLFKLDDEADGRGIAYCDIVKDLNCYTWALKEMAKFGDKWSKRWAHEPTYVKILEEIPDLLSKFAQPANPDIYATWDIYLKAFLTQGGVLEAHPPSDSITSLTVSMIIEPDLSVKILSSGDHIHAESQYSCWGISFPQTSVEAKMLNEACFKIADACKQRHIVGYLDIDFVTFIDTKTGNQMLWATDLNISYTDQVSMTSLLTYMTNGSYDTENHIFRVPVTANDETTTTTTASNRLPLKKMRAKSIHSASSGQSQTETEKSSADSNIRYALMSTKLHHSNLSVIHYSVFFQTCRALGIGYDIKEKQGTVFTLVDSLDHSNMGMLTVTDNLQTAMTQYSNNLGSLHKQISSSNMQGRTNFLLAAEDLKKILGQANENDDDAGE